MKKICWLYCCMLLAIPAMANHLKGGWVQYIYLGAGANNTNRYQIIVRQYLDCNSTAAQVDQQVYLGIYSGASLVQQHTVRLTGTDILNKSSFDPCINPAPRVCYRIDRYEQIVELPVTTGVYTLAVQRCCRIAGIVNVSQSNNVGVTYTNTIPGTITNFSFANNSSPVFAQRDTAVVCYNSPINFDFSASDPDGDSLSYAFCDGIIGGNNTGTGVQPNPPSPPPYNSVFYNPGFSGAQPLGAQVRIDPRTGLITGTTPNTVGDYVVAVCVSEFRNGFLVGITRKEIHVTVANCQISAARLDPQYISCDGFTLNFFNQSTSSDINSYLWTFGTGRPLIDTTSQPTPTFTYPDTGTYRLKLRVRTVGGCADSTTATVKVYPGFIPSFNITGTCYLNPFQFNNTSFTRYGFIDSVAWDFGETSITTDTSSQYNPRYTYPNAGNRDIRLYIRNSKGCEADTTITLAVRDKPIIPLPFRDTLICSIDSVPILTNIPTGIVDWFPKTNMLRGNTANPIVFPKDTTKYYVTVNDNGCQNIDSLTVNVLDFISVELPRDTGICLTDNFTIRPTSFATSYQWTPVTGLNNSRTKNPVATPLVTTKYFVTANLGYCQARDSITVFVTPYPQASVTEDTAICFGERVQLNGRIVGSSFSWSPAASLLGSNTLNPIAGPSRTTTYYLTVRDTVGCPKPYQDSVRVTVVPPITVNAGRDTAVVANQPLRLFAVSSTPDYQFSWTPNIGLNNPNIPNPIATISLGTDSVLYRVRVTGPGGCYGEDFIKVRVFQTDPELWIPSAFTPNKDGRNDVFKPIPVGISAIVQFSIFNRWGQLVFTTRELNKGWDGIYDGIAQPAGTYVYQAEAIDYTGKRVQKKGSFILIR